MQAPMPMDGGSAMEGSTSVQHNLLPQQFVPTQVQESMHGIHYSENPPNHAVGPSTWRDDIIPEQEPSANLFPGLDYENF